MYPATYLGGGAIAPKYHGWGGRGDVYGNPHPYEEFAYDNRRFVGTTITYYFITCF